MLIRTVVAIGGSGFIGRHVAARLAAREIFVRVPTRNRERAKRDMILLPTVDLVQADVHDDAVLKRLMTAADAVINLVGILHEERRRETFAQAHIALPRRIVEACRDARVKRLVHVSALGADATGPSAYQRTKGEGETLVRAAHGPELEVTIVRPSVVFGPGDRFLNLLVRLARILPVMAVAAPHARFQPVYVEDVARAIDACLEDPRTYDRTYDLCGPNVYTLRQLVAFACDSAGLKRPVIGLGTTLSQLQAWVLEHLPGRLMTRDNLASMRVDNVCGCPFPDVFGFAPTALEAVAPTFLGRSTRAARMDQFRVRAGRTTTES
jgi:NADH dehydrogenase